MLVCGPFSLNTQATFTPCLCHDIVLMGRNILNLLRAFSVTISCRQERSAGRPIDNAAGCHHCLQSRKHSSHKQAFDSGFTSAAGSNRPLREPRMVARDTNVDSQMLTRGTSKTAHSYNPAHLRKKNKATTSRTKKRWHRYGDLSQQHRHLPIAAVTATLKTKNSTPAALGTSGTSVRNSVRALEGV